MENDFFQTAHYRFTESSKKVKLQYCGKSFAENATVVSFCLKVNGMTTFYLLVSRRHNDSEILTLYALPGQILAKQLHFSYLKNLLI